MKFSITRAGVAFDGAKEHAALVVPKDDEAKQVMEDMFKHIKDNRGEHVAKFHHKLIITFCTYNSFEENAGVVQYEMAVYVFGKLKKKSLLIKMAST